MWNILERYFEAVKHLQTIWGQLWYANMYIFRLFVILVIGEELYDDAIKEFVCDTNQPGCKVACFNDMVPISLNRFWGLQVLFCSIPVVIFYQYAYKILKNLEKKQVRLESGQEIDYFMPNYEMIPDSSANLLRKYEKFRHDVLKTNGRPIVDLKTLKPETGFETKHGRSKHRRRRKRMRNYHVNEDDVQKYGAHDKKLMFACAPIQEHEINPEYLSKAPDHGKVYENLRSCSQTDYGPAVFTDPLSPQDPEQQISSRLAFLRSKLEKYQAEEEQEAAEINTGINFMQQPVNAYNVHNISPYTCKKLQICYIFTCLFKILFEVVFIFLTYVVQFQVSRVLGVDNLENFSSLESPTVREHYDSYYTKSLLAVRNWKPFWETITYPDKYECNHGQRMSKLYAKSSPENISLSPCGQQAIDSCF